MEKIMGTKMEIRLKPVYTLDRNANLGEIGDGYVSLYKDKKMCYCPFKSSIQQQGLVAYPCGSDCHHFHIIPVVDQEKKPTGKIKVRQTCGAMVEFPISGMEMQIEAKPEGESKTEIKSELRIEKNG